MGASELKALLAAKDRLERHIDESKIDSGWIGEFLGNLHTLNRTHVGTLAFRWPGHLHPLYFRCGSTDLSNFVQIFINKEYDVPLSGEPHRIFDLGGYVGYAAAYFANKFPNASIVTVEPSTDSFRMNVLNTAPFCNVRRLNAAVGEESGTLAIEASIGGDWGATFRRDAKTVGGIPCYTLADLMTWAGWDQFDFLKCDIEGAEREVFRQAAPLIAANVNMCAVEIHEGTTPGAEAAVKGCFDPQLFDHFKNGEFACFSRRVYAHPARPSKVVVLMPSFGLRGIELINVPDEPWGYYVFNGDSCQVHPGAANAPPAILKTEIALIGQTVFDSGVSVSNPLGFPVKFSAELTQLSDRKLIFSHQEVVTAGKRQSMRLEAGPLYGSFQLTLKTQMADGIPTNHQASANWHCPSFV